MQCISLLTPSNVCLFSQLAASYDVMRVHARGVKFWQSDFGTTPVLGGKGLCNISVLVPVCSSADVLSVLMGLQLMVQVTCSTAGLGNAGKIFLH